MPHLRTYIGTHACTRTHAHLSSTKRYVLSAMFSEWSMRRNAVVSWTKSTLRAGHAGDTRTSFGI